MKRMQFGGLVPILGLLITVGHTGGAFADSHVWSTTGNASTDPTTNFLGTTDDRSLVIRTNAEERIHVTSRGRIGIGTASPDAKLHMRHNGGSQGPFLHIEEASGLIGLPHFLFLSSEGQLSVGTNEPEARLHVRAGNGEDSLVVRHFANDHPDLLIDADGNVGINTSDPSARFVIRNHGFGQRPLMSVLAGDHPTFHMSSAGSVLIDPVGAGVALRVRASSGAGVKPVPFHVSAENADAIYVTRDGNVGIGIAGEGINDQLRIRGEENDGTRAAVRIVSGANQQTMLLDGNEIDGVNTGLFLNHNSAENVVLATGGGNVGIGTTDPGNFRLAVNGPIRAKEVVVETGWSDFVFKDDYNLKSLHDVEAYIQQQGHLPDMPSAREVAEQGVSVGEMQSRLLRKIEELTLHLIALNKRVEVLERDKAQLLELREVSGDRGGRQ